MIPAILQNPVVPVPVDSGYATTAVPALPCYVFDGGSVSEVSNPPLDGGNA